MSQDNLIFGNSNCRHSKDEVVEATYKDMKCNVKILREATVEEYLDYLKRMNFKPDVFHGPYYYAGISD